MPNWCSTRYELKCGATTSAEVACEKIRSWMKDTVTNNSWKESWLGNIVQNAGLAVWNEEKRCFEPDFACRGCITDVRRTGDSVKFNTETAWGPMTETILAMCEKHFPEVRLFFEAVEEGCGVYATNYPDEVGKWYMDVWDETPELKEALKKVGDAWSASDEEVIDFYRTLTKDESYMTAEMCVEKLEKDDDLREHLSIHQWEAA